MVSKYIKDQLWKQNSKKDMVVVTVQSSITYMETYSGKWNSPARIQNTAREGSGKSAMRRLLHGYHWQRVEREGQKREI